MDKAYYGVYFPNPATPSWCTFAKPYCGSRRDIEQFYSCVCDRWPGEILFRQFEACRNGQANLDEEFPPVEVIKKERFTFCAPEWDHRNIWDCIYRLRADQIDVEVLWAKSEDELVRYIRPTFYSLQLWRKHWPVPQWAGFEESRFWGVPKMLYMVDDTIYTSLYIRESVYKDDGTEMEHVVNSGSIPDMTSVMNEIFADG